MNGGLVRQICFGVLLATVVLAAADRAGASQPITPGLVGHWTFDEASGTTALDSSPSANHGTLTNVAPISPALPQRSGSIPPLQFSSPSSLSFDGVDDQVAISAAPLASLADTFTLAFWANPAMPRQATTETATGTSQAAPIIVSSQLQRYVFAPPAGTATDVYAGVSVGTNGISVFERGAAGLWPSVLVSTADVSGWTHVTVVYENRIPKLYVNGTFVKTGLSSGKVVRPAPQIGTCFDQNHGPYAGGMDEVRIYNRVLGDVEIAALGAGFDKADFGPPAAATLSLVSAAPRSITLQWTATADDGNVAASGRAGSYDLRMSSAGPITSEAAFEAAEELPIAVVPALPGGLETHTVTGLDPHKTYHFALKTADEGPSWSDRSLSFQAATTNDLVPPAAITDLAVVSFLDTVATLQWSAPADDGNDPASGAAYAYDLRLSMTGPIDSIAAFDAAAHVAVITPGEPGSVETFVVGNLQQDTTYHFAIRSSDRQPTLSPVSNSAGVTTPFGGSAGTSSPCQGSATGADGAWMFLALSLVAAAALSAGLRRAGNPRRRRLALARVQEAPRVRKAARGSAPAEPMVHDVLARFETSRAGMFRERIQSGNPD